MENYLTNQSKIQAQLDQKEAQIPKQIYLGQGLASHLDTRDIRVAHWRKLGTVGAPLHNWPSPLRCHLLIGEEGRFKGAYLQNSPVHTHGSPL